MWWSAGRRSVRPALRPAPEPGRRPQPGITLAELDGAAVGLAALESLDRTQLEDYQPYHAARADLLARGGGREAAVAAYHRAIELTDNPTERRFLERQLAVLPEAG